MSKIIHYTADIFIYIKNECVNIVSVEDETLKGLKEYAREYTEYNFPDHKGEIYITNLKKEIKTFEYEYLDNVTLKQKKLKNKISCKK
jgi:hypothetical protein